MKKNKLNNEIINIDLKHTRRRIYLVILASVILICFGIYDFLRDVPKIVSCFEMIFGSISLLFFLNKLIQFISKYDINEGIVSKVYYDESKKLFKAKIEKYKGVVTCKDKISLNDCVYVICHKKQALLCYVKDKYYV